MRNYRLFFAGQIVSNTGTWMQRIAQDWLVLELTHSPLAVGITTALQFLPMLLFGLWGGLIADRYPKRRLLLITQASMGALAVLLTALTLTGAVQVWQVYLIALGLVWPPWSTTRRGRPSSTRWSPPIWSATPSGSTPETSSWPACSGRPWPVCSSPRSGSGGPSPSTR